MTATPPPIPKETDTPQPAGEARARVLLVVAQLTTGGAEVQLIHLARRLGKLGIHPEVAIYHRGGELEPRLIRAGIKVHHLRRATRLGVETILHLRELLRDGRYDVVHSYLWPANWRARIAGLLAGTPVIISSPRSVDVWLKARHVAVDRLLATWTDAIIVNARAIQEHLMEREGLPASLFRLVYNGLDQNGFDDLPDREEARRTLGLPVERPVALMVGNLKIEKNHEHFLEIAAHTRDRRPDALFVAVGGGNRRAELEAMAERMGLRDTVHWAGLQDDVRPWLAASDVTLNVSHREGCCNAILESMAAGVPVVAYSIGGNPELVDDHETGRLFAPGDTRGCADAVVEYLDRPELARLHGGQGRARARREFTADAMTERTARVYEELLARKGHRARGAGEVAGGAGWAR
jgi:glycosyltransferase involved in cell wall biosynthesis